MKISALALLAGSSVAMGQGNLVQIPPHDRIYTGYSRGLHFTANTQFLISRLEVPPEAMQPGDTAAFLIRVNEVPVYHSAGNTQAYVDPMIVINVGDVVDILGNWSPAVTGNFTANNSYAVSGAIQTNIEGVPHELIRTGVQWDISDPGWETANWITPGTGAPGRVLIYTLPPTTDPGGCCFQDGTCQVLTPGDCANQGGAFRGPNTDCTDPCPQPGACCFPDGSCSDLLEADCTAQEGTWNAGAECATHNCPQPETGACCLPSGSCVIDWEGGCLAQGGLYQGDNTECGTITCPFRIDAHWNSTNNTSGTDAGAYFLVEVHEPQGIIIDGFQINTNASQGSPVTAHVYYRPGTFVGYTGDITAWSLLDEVQTTAAGRDNPTPVPTNQLHLAPGETWALRVGSSAGVAYNNNANTLPTFSDGRVTLHMGEVQSTFFGSTTFGSYPGNLRGWNGSMFYHVGANVTTGACCMPDGSCQEVREAICTFEGGTYHGDNTDCASTPPGGCPQPPTGACCLSDGSCQIDWEGGCADLGGIYHGDGTECANVTCPHWLTTTYESTGSASNSEGPGAYFFVTALDAQGITIESFDINTPASPGTMVTGEVWYRPETFVGFTGDMSAWALLGQDTVPSAGQDNPTPVNIGGLAIAPNETYALRVGLFGPGGIRYNSSTTTPPTYENSQVRLGMGEVQNNYFGTSTFGTYPTSLRGWSGTLYYSLGANVILGACCLPDGSCDELTEGSCTAQGGTYHGDNSECATIPPCPQPPEGACCLGGGVCQVMWEPGCLAENGVYHGDGSECANVNCPLTLTTTFEGGNAQAGAMFDLTATESIAIVAFDYLSSSTAASTQQQIEIYYVTDRTTFVGKENDASLWTLLDTVTVDRQPEPNITHVPLNNVLTIDAGETIGIYFTRNAAMATTSIRYTNGPLGAFTTPHLTFEDRGVGKGYPFGSTFDPRIWNGTIHYELAEPPCYANCDGSTTEPILTVDDFTCFINEFAQAQTLPVAQQIEHYANCDGSTTEPILTVDDFTCFINEFAQGCP